MENRGGKVENAKLVLLTMIRHQWEQGTAAHAFMESGDERIAIMLAHEAVFRQMKDGRLAGVNDTINITDPCVCGESVMFAYKKTGDEKYRKAAQRMLEYIDSAPANRDGIQLHNYRQPMIAADCMYMVPPFYAVMGRYDEAVRQTDLRFRLLWNEEKGAMNHQWDIEKNCLWRDKRWGAASGWNAAAFIRVLRMLPEGMAEERDRIAGYLKTLVAGVLEYQLECGLFHDNLDEDDSFVETNCAQMMAYSIYHGVLAGYLDKRYIENADRMRAAANEKVDADGYVWGAAGAPSFNSYGISPEAQAFYILMESAAKLYHGE
ncbi:hypothetical protein FACS1894191_1840 [Clostridia bacterium]|nr:hypothetical protein FACS1894191_1840 [Clostridia bacterium]